MSPAFRLRHPCLEGQRARSQGLQWWEALGAPLPTWQGYASAHHLLCLVEMWTALTTRPRAGTSATGPARFASVPWDTHLRERNDTRTCTDTIRFLLLHWKVATDQFTFGLALTAPVNPTRTPSAGWYQIQAARAMIAAAMQTAAAPTRQLSAALESLHGQHPLLDAK